MNQVIYIGIDDTDTLDSVGTGEVARGLNDCLVNLGRVKSLGVSRHQMLVNEQIKYTSHNSAKGIALNINRPISDLYEPAINFMKNCFVPGSDPGLCICPQNLINKEILDFGPASQTRVLSKKRQ
jgi:hypothetical protein